MAYGLSWLVYLLAAAGIVFFSYRYIEGFFKQELVLWWRGALLILLFAPWYVPGAEMILPVPAVIAVLFNILAKDLAEVLKALLPILGLTTVFTGALLFLRRAKVD